MVPVRSLPAFAAIVYATLPLPLPVAPEVTPIHGAVDTAVQAQPPGAVTVMLPVVAPAATRMDEVARANTHGVGTGGVGVGAGGVGEGDGAGAGVGFVGSLTGIPASVTTI